MAILTGRRTRAVGGDVPFKESVVQGPRCDEIPGVSVTSEGLKLLWCRTGGDLPRRCRQADLFFEGELYWAVAWEYWLEGNNSSPQTHSALLNTRLPLKVSAPPRLLYCRAASYSVRCVSLCYLFRLFRVYCPCVLIPRVLKIRISKVCYLVIALMSPPRRATSPFVYLLPWLNPRPHTAEKPVAIQFPRRVELGTLLLFRY